MSQKAWMQAYTKGSKSLQARLSKIHANNPEFQEFVKKHGFGGNLSVKQSGLQKKPSIAASKTADGPSEKKNLGREAVIKAAAEKIKDRRAAAANRVAFGGELGGGFSMPMGGFRTYREEFTVQDIGEEIYYKDGVITMHKGGWIAKRDGKRIGTVMPSDKDAKNAIDSTHRNLMQKTVDVLKKKKAEIAQGLGRMSLATESAANRRRVRSWDSAVMPDLKPLRVKPKVKPPFTPDKPKDNAGIIAGKNDPNYSRVRHLARLGIKKAMEK